MALKLLICGDVKGKFDELLTKVASIEKKIGKIDSLFCIGDFFGSDTTFIKNYIESKKNCDVETLIISPLPDNLKDTIDINGGPISPNITYLGNKGTCKFQNKLNIAYLSSMDVVKSDVVDICHELRCTNIGYSGIDILMTNVWPSGIEIGGNDIPRGLKSSEWGSEAISNMISLLQPRYHFSAGRDVYYERIPFKNQRFNQPKNVTRFLALSSVENPQKDKYLYALKLNPIATMSPEDLLQIPSNTTENPFSFLDTTQFLSQIKSNQYFFDNSDLKRKLDNDQSSHSKVSKVADNISKDCWFCLGNSEVQKHLIVEIGELVYIAMPRGALTDDHLMILPVGHYQSLVNCPNEVLKEVRLMIKKVNQYFKSVGKSVVFFERNYKSSHFQLQAVPINDDKMEVCKKLFLALGKTAIGPGSEFQGIPSRTNLQEVIKPGVPYFYVQFSDGEKMLGIIQKSQFSSFDIQFGRTVLCHSSILNLPARANWKNCIVKEDIEETMVMKMRLGLSKFQL